ncbi:unnamed protein product, partial [marine sediment metagenome]
MPLNHEFAKFLSVNKETYSFFSEHLASELSNRLKFCCFEKLLGKLTIDKADDGFITKFLIDKIKEP